MGKKKSHVNPFRIRWRGEVIMTSSSRNYCVIKFLKIITSVKACYTEIAGECMPN